MTSFDSERQLVVAERVRAPGLQRLSWRFARVLRSSARTELSALAFGLACARDHLALRSLAPRIAFFGHARADGRLELKLAPLSAIAFAVRIVGTRLRECVPTLEAKARPSCSWSAFSHDPAPSNRPPALSSHATPDILGGGALCLGAAVGLGSRLRLQPARAELGFTVAAIGSAGAFQWFCPENKLA